MASSAPPILRTGEHVYDARNVPTYTDFLMEQSARNLSRVTGARDWISWPRWTARPGGSAARTEHAWDQKPASPGLDCCALYIIVLLARSIWILGEGARPPSTGLCLTCLSRLARVIAAGRRGAGEPCLPERVGQDTSPGDSTPWDGTPYPGDRQGWCWRRSGTGSKPC